MTVPGDVSMSARVMLVDDDKTIIETLEYNLKRHGFQTQPFYSGRDALANFHGAAADLVILDWMLGDMKGPDVCKIIRSQSSEVPILMLTGRSNPVDIAEGLASGADDYLVKPFSTIELMARVQALLRRSKSAGKKAVLKNGELVLDDEAHSVAWRDKQIDLSPKEFQLLKVLMQNAGKIMTTENLLNEVWGADFSGDIKTVAVHIRWLRQKLEDDPKNPQLLCTVHRAGYRMTRLEGSGIQQ